MIPDVVIFAAVCFDPAQGQPSFASAWLDVARWVIGQDLRGIETVR